MKYQDGNEAMIGDNVELSSRENAVVVASLDSDSYSDDYPQSEWEYLAEGLLVRTETAGLVHFTDNSELVRLIGRGDSK